MSDPRGLARRTIGGWRIRWALHCGCCGVRRWQVERWIKGIGWVVADGSKGQHRGLFDTYAAAMRYLNRRSKSSVARVLLYFAEKEYLAATPMNGALLGMQFYYERLLGRLAGDR